MSVIVVGLEQRHSPLDLLERVAVTERELPKALGRLRDQSNLSEAVILSTCMRTEVYAVVERFHDGRRRAAGVPGHHQRQPAGVAGRTLHRPLRRRRHHPSLHRGRRARLGRARRVRGPRPGPPGVGEGPGRAGVRPGPRRPLPARRRDRQAGPVRDGHRPGHHLAVPRGRGPGRRPSAPTASPRPGCWWWERARWVKGWPRPSEAGARPRWSWPTAPPSGRASVVGSLSDTVAPDVRAETLDNLVALLAASDVVFTSVGTTAPIIDRAMLEAAAAGRDGRRPLLVVDLGVPRNVEPSSADARGPGPPGHGGAAVGGGRRPVRPPGRGGRRHPHRRRRGRAVPGGLTGPGCRPHGLRPAGPGRSGPS